MTLSDSCHCEEKGTVVVIARSGAWYDVVRQLSLRGEGNGSCHCEERSLRSDVAIQYYPNKFR